jgi:hypothetical protein
VRFADRIVAVHRSLAKGGIQHGFGGAIALAYAVDEPRATVDIDLNVAGDPLHPEQVLRALPAGVAWKASDVRAIGRDGQVRLWWDDTRVDLFFPQHELHAVVASRYVTVPFADTTIPVLSPTDLVVFKALFNRTKDWADIEAVLRAGTADVDEALNWIEQIVGTDSASYTRLAALRASNPADGDPGPALWRKTYWRKA